MDAFSQICPYTKNCPLFNGKLFTSHAANEIYLSVYCNNGISGRLDCKRFLLMQAGFTPPQNLMPGDSRTVEDICKNIKTF